jgi:cystathionine beta-lyase
MSASTPGRLDLATALIHDAYEPPAGFASPQPGIYKASTVIFPDVATLRSRDWRRRDGYTYGLHGTPTSFRLEERIAQLEGGLYTLLLPSGLAAVTLVGLALLAPGDELLLPHNVYAPSREFARHELARWGITHRFYDPLDAAGFAAMLTPATKLVWLEAPGSVTMEFPDLGALVAAARAQGVITALDNTWGSGIALRGFEHGIDIVMQALTKYASGGGDVLMGSVTTRDGALHERLKLTHMRVGFGVAANDIEAVLRGLPSMALRYAAQDAAGRRLAQWLAGQPAVAQVLHPALPGSPGHAHWAAHCSAAAGLFSVRFRREISTPQVHAFCDALQLFKLGFSWAGPMSLVVPYDLTHLRPAAAEDAHAGTELVRFSMGLESVDDLQADLAQALKLLHAP